MAYYSSKLEKAGVVVGDLNKDFFKIASDLNQDGKAHYN